MGQGHPSRPNPLLTQTTMGQLCVASWVFRSRPAATQSGIKHGSVVTPQALQCLRPLRHSGGPKVTFSKRRSFIFVGECHLNMAHCKWCCWVVNAFQDETDMSPFTRLFSREELWQFTFKCILLSWNTNRELNDQCASEPSSTDTRHVRNVAWTFLCYVHSSSKERIVSVVKNRALNSSAIASLLRIYTLI